MKALRVILIIVLVLVAAVLIVPLFSPATAEVSAETTIALEPDEIFPTVASFNSRHEWDPWYTQDSTAEVRLGPKQGYVGSTYFWEGQKIGTGRMEVISVKENEYIESSLWFGYVDTPSLVEWHFEAVDGGTKVVWSFRQETTYPIGRLGMMFGKIFLQQSFELGIANLKELMETNPPAPWVLSRLGAISVGTVPAMMTLVADGAGTMETIGEQLGELYGLLFAEAGKQKLEVIGAAFTLYLDYDETTDFTNYLAGVMVNKMGSDAGKVKAVAYPAVEAVQAIHTGPYEEFSSSYDQLGAYIEANEIQTSGQAFEFYQVGMMAEPDPANWETLIAFPLK
jgi:effector-binding domain-containing protein